MGPTQTGLLRRKYGPILDGKGPIVRPTIIIRQTSRRWRDGQGSRQKSIGGSIVGQVAAGGGRRGRAKHEKGFVGWGAFEKLGWVEESVDSIRSIPIRQLLSQTVSLGMIVTSALITWKALMCITRSESPIVVVLSGSMEPAFFKRGDILFLHTSKDPIRAGEIVVFNFDVHERQDSGEVDVLTKDDISYDDDRLLYAEGKLWLQRQHMMGRVLGIFSSEPLVYSSSLRRTEEPPNAGLIIKWQQFLRTSHNV